MQVRNIKKPVQVSYRTVGTDKNGAKRVWLEGLRLGKCGFEAGARYTVALDLERRVLTLTLDPDGERTVSGRKDRAGRLKPLIEVANASMTELVGDAGRVCAALYPGKIAIGLHPVDKAVERREAALKAELAAGELSEGVLCVGGGISALAVKEGLEQAGLVARVDWVVDRDGDYLQAALDNNIAVATARFFEASLEELAPAVISPVSICQFSLPCTGHSPSGKAKRKLVHAEEHPTDALAVYGCLRLLEAANPAVVISENVVPAADSATYALVRAYLQAQGYVLFEKVMDETDAGSLEARRRWWLVGVTRGYAEGFSLDSLPARPRKYATLGEVLEDVADDDPMWAANTYLADKAERDKSAGKGFVRQFVGPDSTSVGTIGRGYAKKRSTEPFIKRADGMERLLTLKEHARVKGFPEALVANLSATLGHEIAGQSILYHHATALLEKVGTHLLQFGSSAQLAKAA